jgi:hypothetical protein
MSVLSSYCILFKGGWIILSIVKFSIAVFEICVLEDMTFQSYR